MGNDALNIIADLGILPVITFHNPEDALPLGRILVEEGLPVAEVVLRTPQALEGIRRLAAEFPQLTVAAGTVLSNEQVDEAVASGAACIVTPGLDVDLVRHCQERGIPVIPGCAIASEINTARKLGLRVMKFFPVSTCGGLDALKMLHGPFPDCSFVPTGVIDFGNMADYLSQPWVAAVGGSFVARPEEIQAGHWEQIRANVRACVDISLGFSLAHVGINHGTPAEAEAAAKRFSVLFRMPLEGNSTFVGKVVENPRVARFGTRGHIAFYTRSIRRAHAYYRAQGIPVREADIHYDEHGNYRSFYLQEEIAGFAIHLLQK